MEARRRRNEKIFTKNFRAFQRHRKKLIFRLLFRGEKVTNFVLKENKNKENSEGYNLQKRVFLC